MPDGLKSIGDYAFSGCSKLKNIDIPDGNETIGDHAFNNCKGLEKMTIPASTTSIGSAEDSSTAFDGCDNLKEIDCEKGSTADDKSLYPGTIKIIHSNEPPLLFKYGDVDANDSLQAADATVILQKVLVSTYKMPIEEKTDDWMKYADVSNDGFIMANDSAMILQKVLNSSYTMPVEIQ